MSTFICSECLIPPALSINAISDLQHHPFDGDMTDASGNFRKFLIEGTEPSLKIRQLQNRTGLGCSVGIG
jgi:hypothetical protein